MNHSIKMIRSRTLAPHVPSAQAEIDASISPALVEDLTAARLADLRRCLDAHCHKAVRYAEKQVLAEGGVWDEGSHTFRELARA